MASQPLTVAKIARAIDAQLDGDGSTRIRAGAAVESAGPDEITFAVDARRLKALNGCRAGAVVVPTDAAAPAGLTVLRVADPMAAFARVLALIAPREDLPGPGVHPSAVVDPTARLGTDVAVGPHAVIGADVTLGERVTICAGVCLAAGVTIEAGSVLFPGVVVRERCRIGRRCRVHPNSVIGADGFGYYYRDGVQHKVPHVGIVEIGDDVEIGACACVDRAKFGITRIDDGAKIDNLVQIAHNVQVGRGALLAGQTGIAGSVRIGPYAAFGGNAGVVDNVSVGAGAMVAAKAAVLQDVADGEKVGGVPAMSLTTYLRGMLSLQKLPELTRQVKKLQARLDALEDAAEDDRK